MGRFRQDLYYRLSAARIVAGAPAGAARRSAGAGVALRESLRQGGPAPHRELDPTMMEIFANYHWPGNVRQLRNVVLTSLILGTGPVLSLADVSWLFDELQPLTVGNVARDDTPAGLRPTHARSATPDAQSESRAGPPASAAFRSTSSSGRPSWRPCGRPPATRPRPPRSWASATARCGRRSAATAGGMRGDAGRNVPHPGCSRYPEKK